MPLLSDVFITNASTNFEKISKAASAFSKSSLLVLAIIIIYFSSESLLQSVMTKQLCLAEYNVKHELYFFQYKSLLPKEIFPEFINFFDNTVWWGVVRKWRRHNYIVGKNIFDHLVCEQSLEQCSKTVDFFRLNCNTIWVSLNRKSVIHHRQSTFFQNSPKACRSSTFYFIKWRKG